MLSVVDFQIALVGWKRNSTLPCIAGDVLGREARGVVREEAAGLVNGLGVRLQETARRLLRCPCRGRRPRHRVGGAPQTLSAPA
jgi:hypothetical protein